MRPFPFQTGLTTFTFVDTLSPFVCFAHGGDQLHRLPDFIWPQVVNIVDANGPLRSLNTANSRILASQAK
jgi:hypothetical protein